tara:strand:- start:144 stop:284 length:141 start_codon:yes stop_codon:yes gene_type:complete
MMRKKIIKVGGDSIGIRFNVNEAELYDLVEGDILDLTDVFKVENKK